MLSVKMNPSKRRQIVKRAVARWLDAQYINVNQRYENEGTMANSHNQGGR
jgi:hypothetical protein